MQSHLNRGRVLAFAVLASALLVARPRGAAESIRLETGDIVFQRSRSAQSTAIALATGSTYTHMGVVLRVRDRVLVLEAVGPVRLTPFAEFANRGLEGEYVVKRLRDRDARITPAMRARMERVGRSYLGRAYDERFEWSDDRIYCSELVYKIFERGAGIRLGELVPAHTLDLDQPAVRALIARRYRRAAFDPNEPVISPGAMFADPALETVLAR